MSLKIEAAKRLEATKNVKASDAVEYVPTPGAKKEKPADWEADVPVVKSEATQRLAATKGKKAPAVKTQKPHKAKAPTNPEPKKKKPTKASFEESAVTMANVMKALRT